MFPGAVDCHVHFSEPGRADWEGISHGSQMMAAAGCTAYFDMPLNGIPSTVTVEALKEKARIAKEKSLVDFALWGGLVHGNRRHIKKMTDAGAIGFKAFLSQTGTAEFQAADDMSLLEGMREIAACKKILALHAESDAMIQFLQKEAEQSGRTDGNAYAASRPPEAEAEAVMSGKHGVLCHSIGVIQIDNGKIGIKTDFDPAFFLPKAESSCGRPRRPVRHLVC